MYPYGNFGQSQELIQNELLKSLGTQPQQTQRHVTKVNGRAGADSFNLPPNSDDILVDMNEAIIYFVQTDGAGYKTVTPYDYSPHKEVKPEDKYNALEERIQRLEEKLNVKSNNRSNEQHQHNNAGDRSNDKR